MKAAIRAAGIGFGGTLGAGAAVLVAGALVAIATRSAVRKTADDIAARVSELIDQAVAKVADEQVDPDHPDSYEQDHVHTSTCPCPAVIKYCGKEFGGVVPCVMLTGHAGQHRDSWPANYGPRK